MRGVIYARYSADRQRETSIDDQVRNCTRLAGREGIAIAQVYADKAISGAIRARPDYQRMLADAAEGSFDVLLVDDLSRLSRDDYEMKGVLRRFDWRGLRVIGVTDGYDSSRKGHKIHAGFKGLMNELFLDDLRERVHRGLTGQALKGYACGGRTYGYRNVPIEDATRKDTYGRPAVVAVRIEIEPVQADIVRRIFEWYAAGHSYKWIAAELNRLAVPSSRGGTWAVSAIKVVLENELYEGKRVWNRRAYAKHPDTGRRTYRYRPQSDWIVTQDDTLRIVSPAIVSAVRARQRRNARQTDSRAAAPAQKYLFSGLMVCAECGANFVIGGRDRYGCAANRTRGPEVCDNRLTVSRHVVEERLLQTIKQALLTPPSVARFHEAAAAIMRSDRAATNEGSVKRKLQDAARTRDNLLAAIKQGIITPGTKRALELAEEEVASLSKRLDYDENLDVTKLLPQAIERYRESVACLEQTLSEHVEPAREILRTLVGDRIPIHRRGDRLDAELPDQVQMALVNALNQRADLFGSGGGIWNKSNTHRKPLDGANLRGSARSRSIFVSLEPSRAGSQVDTKSLPAIRAPYPAEAAGALCWARDSSRRLPPAARED